MKKRKIYKEAFKRKVVTEVLSGSITKEEAMIRYGIGGNSMILDWMRKYAGFKMRTSGLDPLPILHNMKTDESKEELKEWKKQLEAKLKYTELKGRDHDLKKTTLKLQKEYGVILKEGNKRTYFYEFKKK